jgi:HD-like signal output (HDOD) protein
VENNLWIWPLGAVSLAVAWWWWKRPVASALPPSSPADLKARAGASRKGAPLGTASGPLATDALQPEAVPPELASLRWLSETDLPAPRRATLLAAVKGIPRPPNGLRQLISPDFLAKVGSTELSDLVMSEPLIAARVLSTVNSPLYGLQQPVTNMGQAVTFLGINTVRSICLQYMLAEAFKPRLAAAQTSFDTLWRASAIASDLCVRLGKALNLPDQGTLSTQVVLSFVGQLATASLLPANGLAPWMARDRVERARLEQDLLGLNATEIGCLLLRHWELPESITADVRALGMQMVAPASDPARAPSVALGYLCSRLGERLANGHLVHLDGYDPMQDIAADTHHLRAALQHPALARIGSAMLAPELLGAVRRMARPLAA